MEQPLMATRHRPGRPQDPQTEKDELAELLRQINRQEIKPEPLQVLAMALILLLFLGAVLMFSLAATQTL